jgi:thiamine biosynthesis protein ThiS
MNSLNGWAVAVNEEVVPTDKLTHFILSDNDRIILIQATQGG